MVHFVGAGPGAPDLITRRGAALLQEADCIIYAGSLVNPALLGLAKPECAVYNSAEMTLEQVLDVMRRVEAAGGTTVRLHTGDPCLYGAIREQMDALDADGIPYDDTPGVVQLLRGGGGAERRVHPANHQSDRDHHPDGGAHPGAGKGAAGQPCRLWGDHGDLPLHRPHRQGAAGPCWRRSLHAGDPLPPWSTRPAGRSRRWCAAPWARWPGAPAPTASPKQRSSWWGDFLGTRYERSKLYDPTFTTEFRKGADQ